MAEELQRIEVSPGRFKKMTRAQAEAYQRAQKEAEPANKTVSSTGMQVPGAVAEGEGEDAPRRPTRRTTKRSSK